MSFLVTENDLLAFLAGKADDDTRQRIAEELKNETSNTRRYLEKLWALADVDPLKNVAWGRLLADEDESEFHDQRHQTEPRAVETGARSPVRIPVVLVFIQGARLLRKGDEPESEIRTITEYQWHIGTKAWSLPEDVATRCYAKPEQKVKLKLIAETDMQQSDLLIPRIEVSPAPWCADFAVAAEWLDQTRRFRVEKADTPRQATESDIGDPLPAALVPIGKDAHAELLSLTFSV